MSPAVIKAMVAFVYLAIIKDAIIGFIIFYFYKDQGMDILTSRDLRTRADRSNGKNKILIF